MDSNHRPSGYEPDELPLLHAALSYGARSYSPSGLPASTIGAAVFHLPVRDGSEWVHGATRTPLAQGPVQCECQVCPFELFLLALPSLPAGKPSPMRSRRLHVSPRLQLGPLAQSSPGGLTGLTP